MQTKPVQNKPANRWLDIQLVIVTLAMTFVLALWNMFAGNDRISASSPNTGNQPGTSVSSAISSTTSTSGSRILLGGSAPSNAPRPLTLTSSSRP